MIALLLTAPVAHAQMIAGDAYVFPLSDNVEPLLNGSLFSESYLDGKASDRRSNQDASSERGRRSPRTGADLSLRFAPSVSRLVRANYIAAIGRANGERAALGLGAYYAANDVRELPGRAVRPYGLSTDDLADITTAYLVVMWMTANQAPLPGVPEVRGVQQQVRQLLLDGGRVPARMRDRQRTAEGLMYQTVTLIRVREEAETAGNAEFLARLADSAQKLMARQAFDLRGLVLSPHGMVVPK